MGVLRTLLAISVVLVHSAPILGFSMVGGMLAVQAFFIISGFYMSLILNEKYVNENGSYKLFITNRFLRLYPIYWVVLIVTLLYSLALHYNTDGTENGLLTSYFNTDYHLNFIGWIYLAFSNVFIFLQDAVVFMGLNPQSGALYLTENFANTNPKLYSFMLIPQGWTVGIELMFYLIAPFLVRRKVKIILILVALCLILRILMYNSGYDYDPWTYRFFPFELVFFLLGNVAYRIYRRFKDKMDGSAIPWICAIVSILMTCLYDKVNFEGQIFVFYFVIFISVPFIFILTKRSRWDRMIGELSYPIYISHILMILVLNTNSLPYIGGYGGTTLILTIGFSIGLNWLVAQRIEKYRQKRLR
jgi:peptidoglycan/LPS O-acetylase OafA/YrhL